MESTAPPLTRGPLSLRRPNNQHRHRRQHRTRKPSSRNLSASAAQRQPDPVDQYIGAYFPGAAPNKRQWLRSNQHYLANPGLVHAAAGMVLQHGVPRESPQFLQAVGALIDQHHAAQQPAPPMPEPMPAQPPITHVDISQTESPEAEPEEMRMAAHVSPPVSRGDYALGEPEPTLGRITLSPAEREMAKASGVSDEVYAAGKLKLAKLKKSKVIQD